MQVEGTIEGAPIPAALRDVLRRLVLVDDPTHPPADRLVVKGRLVGGKSGSEVLEVVVHRGTTAAPRVVKVGPRYDLHEEIANWQALQPLSPPQHFTPIVAATPALVDGTASDELQAVVYDHVASFRGRREAPVETLERLARQAIVGEREVAEVQEVLDDLFQGVQLLLYGDYHETDGTLIDACDRRLGECAVLEVDRVEGGELTYGPVTLQDRQRARWYPDDLLDAAYRSEPLATDPTPGSLVRITDLYADWWGDRLMGGTRSSNPLLRVEIVAADGISLRRLSGVPQADAPFSVTGRLRQLRGANRRASLLRHLGADFALRDGRLSGPGAEVGDPFGPLGDVMRARRGRLVSRAHGDLNPRNVLVAAGQPYLIDFAFTRAGEPLLLDFARLEGVLARACLPADLTWAQHVRLARLVALVSALGEPAVDPFARRLADARADLGRAFRVLAAVRLAARRAYPEAHRAAFARDHHEQTLLFAHLALKWAPDPERNGADVRAIAALAGAAAEALDSRRCFYVWTREALLADGAAVTEVLAAVDHATALPLAAALARRIDRLDPPPGAEEPLVQHLESARRRIVFDSFQDEARAAVAAREDEHRAFIRLKAFIELQAALRAAEKERPRAHTFREALLDDDLLARSERLREEGPGGEDIISLLAREPRLVLLGDAGAGKTSVARHWEHQLARAVLDRAANEASIYAPILHIASAVAKKLGGRKLKDPGTLAAPIDLDPDHLALGTVHLTIDALNEVPNNDRRCVAEWIAALANAFPRLRILACHRLYNYLPGLLPFPVGTLQKVGAQRARGYVFDYLAACSVPDHPARAERLVHLLFDDPEREQLRDLAQTPLFLWMIVEYFRKTEALPTGRGALFRTFVRWYLTENWHARTREAMPTDAEVAEREALLGRLGFALVEQGATTLSMREARKLAGKQRKQVLDAVIRSEMLGLEQKGLRFLHQSFQEYFAARHFLETEAREASRLAQLVHRLSWQDTFVLLLGFAGEFQEVSRRVIEIALGVHPVLTARCLRMGESLDPALLPRFVAEQEATLRDRRAGTQSWETAARALAEHGRGPTRRALLAIAADPAAPVPARCNALKCLATMPTQVRFEPVMDKIRRELTTVIEPLLDEEAPEAVRMAAIEAVAEAKLTAMSGYLGEQLREGSWQLRQAAGGAYKRLGVKLTAGQRRMWAEAARERISGLEAELHQEAVRSRIQLLNEERIEILRAIAEADGSDALPLLLERRFLPEIGEQVCLLVNTAKDAAVRRPPSHEGAKAALTLLCQSDDGEQPIAEWLRLLRYGTDLEAVAAAHLLCMHAKRLAAKELAELLDPQLSPVRLGAVAGLARTQEDTRLAEPLEGLLTVLMERMSDVPGMEAFLSLFNALQTIDPGRGPRVGVLAEWVFYSRRWAESHAGRYPWCLATYSLRVEDYATLLEAGGERAHAAVARLSAYGGATLLMALRGPLPTKLSAGARAQLSRLATAAAASEAYRYASAAVETEATDLLPWLTSLVDRRDVRVSTREGSSVVYGVYKQSDLAVVLRATGYLARIAFERRTLVDPTLAIDALQRFYAMLLPDEDRSILVGITTALGFLGRWEPTLEHLGPREPWMHDVALNIFAYWVPAPPNGTAERKRAQAWLKARLQRTDLAPEVRTTLLRLRDALAASLGSY